MIFSLFKWNPSSVMELTKPKNAYIYYRSTRLNLITGFPETYPLDLFLKKLESINMQDSIKDPLVFHFYYEFGLIQMGLGHTVDENTPLAIEIEYQNKRIKKLPKTKLSHIPLKTLERPSWSEYKEAFYKVQEHLLDGNAYQVNLTYPFEFETEEIIDPRDVCDFFFSRNNLSAYAHSTFLGDELILSNSPECLFHYQNQKILTVPIKGTRKITNNWKEKWNEMLTSPKEEGELNMITDLLRNDLNKIEFPQARVLKAKAPLRVQGLLHQISILSVKIEKQLSLLRTIECLFPGGSVTGAPKKRVMEIIQEVERSPRGIYCGSTLLCVGAKKMASINIRTASVSVNERLWRYGAGGGVTLLSKANHEFQEMDDKVSSFLTLLNVSGYKAK